MKKTLAALVLAVLAAGCRKGDEVQVYRARKEAAPPMPETADRTPAAAQGELHWKAPAGWQAQGASGMRYATFKIPGRGKPEAELSVVVLPGDAGGPLANVNRWRGQMGLGPLDQKALDAASSRVQSLAGMLLAIDFEAAGGQKRLLGAILTSQDKTWFFKLTGDAASVGAAKPDFNEFIKSLRPASS